MEIFGVRYKLVENHNEGFNEEEFLNKVTDYFIKYDFIVGDISYGKLRIKGFAKRDNKSFNEINNCEKIKRYIEDNCAYGCKYFILEKEIV